MFKRIFAILLAALMLLPLAACGESTETPDVTTDGATGTDTEAATEFFPNVEKQDYEGETFQMIGIRDAGVWVYGEDPTAANVNVLNDTLYEMNTTVEEYLSINIAYEYVHHTTGASVIFEAVQPSVMAGDDTYQLCILPAYRNVASFVTQDCVMDLYDLNDYIDLDQPYWMQDYNEMLSYHGMQFTATGSIALSTYRFAFVTMFNKVDFDDKKVPYLYEAVNNGEWTLDFQAALAEDFYQDLNGNGKKDEGDFFGLITSPYISTDPYWASCDLSLVEKNADGEYAYVLDTARLSNVADKVLRLLYESGTLVYPHTGADAEQDDIRIAFARGDGAMCTTRLVAAEMGDIRNMEDAYGIVPMPKLSKEQADYKTYVQDQVSCFGISAAIGDETRQEQLAATLEAMSYYSYNIVRPAYYDSVLSLRFMQDPQSRDVLNTMFDSISFDFVYATSTAGIRDTLRGIISQPNAPVASSSKQWERQVQSAIRSQEKAFDRLLSSGN